MNDVGAERYSEKLLIYLSAYGSFEKFLLLSAFSYLRSNSEFIVEVAVENSEEFRGQNSSMVSMLNRVYPGRLNISQFQLFEDVPRASRFIEQPEWIEYASHVFIADVDVLNLDSELFNTHLEIAKSRDKNFSNVLRPDEHTDPGYPRLTGCHFTSVDSYYPIPSISELQIPPKGIRGTDENILYQIVRKKLNPTFHSRGFRPIHGIHITPSRRPFGKEFRHLDGREDLERLASIQASADHLGIETSFWQGVANLDYRRAFDDFWNCKLFQKIFFLLDPCVQQRLLVLKFICDGEYASWQKNMIMRYLPYDLYRPAVLHSRLVSSVKKNAIQFPVIGMANKIRKIF